MFTKKQILGASFFFLVFYVCFVSVFYFLRSGNPMEFIDLYNIHYIFFLNSTFFLGGITAFLAIKKPDLPKVVKQSLVLLGIGSFCMGLGFLSWLTLEVGLGEAELYPSLADVFYVAFVPLVVLGLLNLLRVFSFALTKKAILKAIGLVVFSSFLTIQFGVFALPEISEDSTILVTLFDTFYAFTDIVLIAIVVLTLSIAGGKIFKGLLVYLVGLVFNVVADLVFFYRIEAGTHAIADIADHIYFISACVMTAGIYLIAKNFVHPEEVHALKPEVTQ